SSAGPKKDGTYRPGGPLGLLTDLCWFSWQKDKRRFRLDSVHPGRSLEEVRDNTGFDFDCPDHVPQTQAPDQKVLNLLRTQIAADVAETYPRFAERMWGAKAG